MGCFGGVFRVTEGLQTKYGKSRCFDARSRRAASSARRGHGAYGLRPVVEIQFADYFYPAMDQIVSEAARLRLPLGGRLHRAHHHPHALRRRHLRRQTHSQSPEAIFTHVCGVRTVMPSNPYDARAC